MKEVDDIKLDNAGQEETQTDPEKEAKEQEKVPQRNFTREDIVKNSIFAQVSKAEEDKVIADTMKKMDKSFNAQKDVMDKMWACLQHSSYNHLVMDLLQMNLSLDESHFSDDDNPPTELDDFLERQKKYKEDNKNLYFSDEEAKKLGTIYTNEEKNQIDNKCVNEIDILKNLMRKDTKLEDNKSTFEILGMLKAKVEYEIGKEYQKWYNKIDKNDPDRDLKAQYLTMYYPSKVSFLYQGYSDLKYYVTDNFSPKKYTDSILFGDMDKFKKLTFKEYFNTSYTSKEERKHLLEEYNKVLKKYQANKNHYNQEDVKKIKDLKEVNENTNICDFFRIHKYLKNPNKGITSDSELRKYVHNEFYLKLSFVSWTLAGQKLVEQGLSKEDRELMNKGTYVSDNPINYHIHSWVKDLDKMIYEKRVEEYNKADKEFKEELNMTKPYNIKQGPMISKIFHKENANGNPYIDYINKHIGLEIVLNKSLKEKKNHLAKAMSALSFYGPKDSKDDMVIGAIHNRADRIKKRKVFQNMTEREVDASLSNLKQVGKSYGIVLKKTFDVSENKRQEYINEMKVLQTNMMSGEKRSPYYNDFCKAISDVAQLKPDASQNEIIAANAKLVYTIEAYTAGKKKVRITDGGKARFNNALDAISIVNKYIKGSSNFVKEQVDRINEVRNASKGDKNFVDINKYGAERAKNEKAKKEAKQEAKKKSQLKK
ncbi:MAG: hypothetical protein K6E10_03395 [Eubacterium sp.]|nr:hypothetical protein [Eubacterium sp.]